LRQRKLRCSERHDGERSPGDERFHVILPIVAVRCRACWSVVQRVFYARTSGTVAAHHNTGMGERRGSRLADAAIEIATCSSRVLEVAKLTRFPGLTVVMQCVHGPPRGRQGERSWLT